MVILRTDRHTFWAHSEEYSFNIIIHQTHLISHTILTKLSDFEKTGGKMAQISCLPSTAPAVVHHLTHSLSIYNFLYVCTRTQNVSFITSLNTSNFMWCCVGCRLSFPICLRVQEEMNETYRHNMASCVKKRNLLKAITRGRFFPALFCTVLSPKTTRLFLLRFLSCC